MTSTRQITIFIVGLLMAITAKSQQEYLANRQFDSDLAGWSFESTGGTGLMEWDGALGNPNPGSLKLSGSGLIVSQRALNDSCFTALPGTTWTLTLQGRKEVGAMGTCAAALRIYDTDDCVDPNYLTLETNPTTFNNWTTLEVSVDNVFGGTRGVKPYLFLSSNSVAGGVCNFDDVSLIGPSPATVPALAPIGLGLLIAALLLAGTVILRKTTL